MFGMKKVDVQDSGSKYSEPNVSDEFKEPDIQEIYLPDEIKASDTGDAVLNEKIAELSKLGYQFLKEGNIEDSINSFEEVLTLDPNNNYALVGLGDAMRKNHDYLKSIEYYNKCLQFHENNNYALFGLADCYKALNQFTKAIQIWEQYLKHDDKNITVLTRVADAYRKIRIFKRSKEIYLKVLELENTNPYALIGLGHLHYDYKEYKEALHYWTRMYNQNQESCDIRVLTSLGNCHRKLKTYADGIPYFNKALERDPVNFYALFGMADCYRGLNRQKESIYFWNKILDIDPENKVILTRAGDAYRNIGEYDKAKEYYNKALDIDFDIYAALGLALLCKDEGKYEEAIERLKQLIRGDKKNYRLYVDLADCFLQMGRKAEAVSTLEEFQRTGIKSQAVNEMMDRLRY